jgi:hypothetical protein
MVERRDVVAARRVERVVDGVRAGRLPEGVRVIGVARTLGQFPVADAGIGMRLQGRARVRLRVIAADEHLDVRPGPVEHRGEGHRQQRRDVAPDGDPHGDQRLAVRRRLRGAVVAPAVQAGVRCVEDALGPGCVGDDLFVALGRWVREAPAPPEASRRS